MQASDRYSNTVAFTGIFKRANCTMKLFTGKICVTSKEYIRLSLLRLFFYLRTPSDSIEVFVDPLSRWRPWRESMWPSSQLSQSPIRSESCYPITRTMPCCEVKSRADPPFRLSNWEKWCLKNDMLSTSDCHGDDTRTVHLLHQWTTVKPWRSCTLGTHCGRPQRRWLNVCSFKLQ